MNTRQTIGSDFLTGNNISLFRHKAMNTIFELYIADEERQYSSQAAHEVFKEIDLIENDLSKFIPNSDISKINNLPVNTAAVVGEHAFEALKDCSELYEITGGSFDVTSGELIESWKEGVLHEDYGGHDATLLNEFPLTINESDFSIIKNYEVSIDMGGYGKGYALDKAADLLKEWSVNSFLISGGYSTVRAYDSKQCIDGWPVSITDPARQNDIKILSIQNTALSSSGLEKGQHIIDPRKHKPPQRKAAWAACGSAAWSDAFSTAFMILDVNEVSQICSEHKIDALLIGQNEEGNSANSFGTMFRSV